MKPRVALKYLKMALKLEKGNRDTKAPELAATYLNLCAIYSELSLHGEAINKAVKSVLLIKTYLKKITETTANTDLDKVITSVEKSKPSRNDKNSITINSADESELLKLDTKPSSMRPLPASCSEEDTVTLMGTYCAAYFNLGVSFEHVK